MPNQDERRVSKILWSMVSKAADRSRRQRHEIWRKPIALIIIIIIINRFVRRAMSDRGKRI